MQNHDLCRYVNFALFTSVISYDAYETLNNVCAGNLFEEDLFLRKHTIADNIIVFEVLRRYVTSVVDVLFVYYLFIQITAEML